MVNQVIDECDVEGGDDEHGEGVDGIDDGGESPLVKMMVREARVEAGRVLPTGQSDTGKFSAAGKHYFTLEYSRAC